MDTAAEETIYLDSEIANNKLAAFNTQVFSEAVKAIVQGVEGRQELRETNSHFVAKHGKKTE